MEYLHAHCTWLELVCSIFCFISFSVVENSICLWVNFPACVLTGESHCTCGCRQVAYNYSCPVWQALPKASPVHILCRWHINVRYIWQCLCVVQIVCFRGRTVGPLCFMVTTVYRWSTPCCIMERSVIGIRISHWTGGQAQWFWWWSSKLLDLHVPSCPVMFSWPMLEKLQKM